MYGSMIEGSEVVRKEFAQGWARMSAILALQVNNYQLLLNLIYYYRNQNLFIELTTLLVSKSILTYHKSL